MRCAISIAVLVFLISWVLRMEFKHMQMPHTVVHRDGRVWYLSGSPVGHRLNGSLRFNTITFNDDFGYPISFHSEDVKVYCHGQD